MPTAETKRHWTKVAELGCLITDRPYPTLHHCKGGSIVQVIGRLHGMKLKPNDWLVVPLDAEYHTGDKGIDRIGVKTWEARYRTQVELLDIVCHRLGYDVWAKAGIKRDLTPFFYTI